MQKQSQFGIAAVSLLGMGALSVVGIHLANANGAAGAQPAPKCKISPVDAISIALKKSPGKPLQANFEFDEGHWVYGVMIVNGHTLKEVEVDPMSGKVLATETVTPEDEAKEMKAGLLKAIGGKSAPSKPSAEETEADEKDEKPEKP